jgi:glycosyltransferase involved in cell wall biosynthesis
MHLIEARIYLASKTWQITIQPYMNPHLNNTKLKVALITNLFPNPQEPIRGIFVFNLAKELKNKCTLTVVSPLPWCPAFLHRFKKYQKLALIPKEFEIEGIKVYSPKYLAIPKLGVIHPLFIFVSLFGTILNLRKKQGIDVINAHWVFPDGVAVSWIARIMRLPLALTAHGCDINLYSSFPCRRPQIIGALKSANRVIAISEAQKKVMQGLKIKIGKITVIKNGVDFNDFILRNKEECRIKLGLPRGEKIILFVGQIIEVKGVNYLVEAVTRFRKEASFPFKLIIIGEGHLKNLYKQKVSDLNLSNEILFLEEKSRAEIPYWYGACDAFCLPSIREGCPAVILEALASGRPVAASRVGGIPELINKENGILFDAGNVNDLTVALKATLEKKWDAQEIRDTISGLSWADVAGKYLTVFNQVFDRIK